MLNQYLFQFFYVIFHFLRYEHNKKASYFDVRG
nr:MAG TPA: hypothetical protein [Caudoviricetes sp.]DAP86533.1 MAG TPA: hypothetical protein [Caudoviricetes sp.]